MNNCDNHSRLIYSFHSDHHGIFDVCKALTLPYAIALDEITQQVNINTNL